MSVPCNEHPENPQFKKRKVGFTEVFIIFLYVSTITEIVETC